MSLTQQQTDWLECFEAYIHHMQIESSSLEYDFEAGRAANRRYIEQCMEYERKHGKGFMPDYKLAPELYAARRTA